MSTATVSSVLPPPVETGYSESSAAAGVGLPVTAATTAAAAAAAPATSHDAVTLRVPDSATEQSISPTRPHEPTSPNTLVTRNAEETWRLNIDVFSASRRNIATKGSAVSQFYKSQNDIIDRYVRADNRMRARARGQRFQEQQEAETRAVKFGINASFTVNVLLFCVKIFAAIYSRSLAVIGSAIDSALDLLSGSIIYFAARIAARKNPYKYPIGRTRLEPLAIVVFASIMGMAALQLLSQAIQTVVEGLGHPPEINIDEESSSIAALAQDHRNDVITNTSTLIAVLLASRFPAVWWLDAAMAIAIALLIVVTWATTGKDHIVQLSGRVAEPEILSELTYIAFNHDARVKLIDTVRAYYLGTKLLVECDIVLPEAMPLKEAHDIGESLQREIEEHEDVERAFVHLDTETDHRAADEHAPV